MNIMEGIIHDGSGLPSRFAVTEDGTLCYSVLGAPKRMPNAKKELVGLYRTGLVRMEHTSGVHEGIDITEEELEALPG